jgi:membrane protein YqaA with SNARE-associated domain
MLAGLLAARPEEAGRLLAVATIGNTAGAAINWLLGRFAIHWRERRWFPVKPAALDRASAWFARWGLWSLLLSWVPVIGDPLTLAAGLLRVPFGRFLMLVAIGKALRYAAVAMGVMAFRA